MTAGGSFRQPKGRSRLGERQPHEVPQFDEIGLERVLGRQLIQGPVQGDQVFARLRLRGQIRFEVVADESATVPIGHFSPGVIDQDAPHGLGGGSEEMAAMNPTLGVGWSDQSQIRFMNESSRLQSVSGRFHGQSRRGKGAQLGVDQWQDVGGSLSVAGRRRIEELGYVGHSR